MRITRAVLAPVLLLATACDVGNGDDGGGGNGMVMDSTPDDRVCSAQFAVTGTFTLGTPPPDLVDNETGDPGADGTPDDYGCWPTGTWTFRVGAQTEGNCSTPPMPETEYRFVTTFSPNGTDGQGAQFDYQLQAPALSSNYRLKVSSTGSGCEGVMELYLDGGKKAWYLHPLLTTYNMSGPLAGSADYNEYAESIYP